MKKLLTMLCALMLVSLVACSSKTTVEETATPETTEMPTTVKLQSYNGNRELVEVEVPYNPQRIAVMDMAALDIIDALGVGSSVVATSKVSLEYLSAYKDLGTLGSIKEADMEAVNAAAPEVIFIGGRLSKSYDELSKIAPVVFLPGSKEGTVASVKANALAIASLFGKEAEVDTLMSQFDGRIATLKEFASGKSAIVGLTTGGALNVLGNDGRCSIVGVEIGFENIGVDANIDTSTHGNEASFEYIVEKDPDYIFVMDRDAAIGKEGATLAADLLNNDLVNSTRAVKEGHLVIFENPLVWYTAEGGITALDIMLSDMEKGLGLQ